MPRTAALLAEDWPAFYLGSIAPDYQVICGVPREASHFYPLPLPDGWDAPAEMLRQHPQLAAERLSDASRQAFISAYLVHLLLDMDWFRQVLMPYFVQPDHLGAGHERMILHNFTLMVLDSQAYSRLPAGAAKVLAAVRPTGWLPFARDDQLTTWQDLIAGQLTPGAEVQTVPIYAQRMGIPADQLANQLKDPVWLERELFSKVSLPEIEAHLERTLASAEELLASFLGNRD